MLEYIRGTLTEAGPLKAVVEINGHGYKLHIPFSNYSKLPALGKEALFYISTVIREDAHKLYGFVTRQERNLFEQFIEVSGIGAKTALSLVGHIDASDLQMAISQANVNLICKVPGVGKKTAERLIIDMRDKFKKTEGMTADTPHEGGGGVVSDAISALVNLGYQPLLAQNAVKKALSQSKNEPDLAKLITSALRSI
jgi:holliday junction DNA helicase RuvA